MILDVKAINNSTVHWNIIFETQPWKSPHSSCLVVCAQNYTGLVGDQSISLVQGICCKVAYSSDKQLKCNPFSHLYLLLHILLFQRYEEVPTEEIQQPVTTCEQTNTPPVTWLQFQSAFLQCLGAAWGGHTLCSWSVTALHHDPKK